MVKRALSKVSLFRTLNAKRKLFSLRSDDDDEVVLLVVAVIEGFFDRLEVDLSEYLRRRWHKGLVKLNFLDK